VVVVEHPADQHHGIDYAPEGKNADGDAEATEGKRTQSLSLGIGSHSESSIRHLAVATRLDPSGSATLTNLALVSFRRPGVSNMWRPLPPAYRPLLD
jgi:hypothetical protein